MNNKIVVYHFVDFQNGNIVNTERYQARNMAINSSTSYIDISGNKYKVTRVGNCLFYPDYECYIVWLEVWENEKEGLENITEKP